jgi:hypothetical protein
MMTMMMIYGDAIGFVHSNVLTGVLLVLGGLI